MLPNKQLLLIIVLGLLVGVTLALALRYYPTLRFITIIFFTVLSSFLLRGSEV